MDADTLVPSHTLSSNAVDWLKGIGSKASTVQEASVDPIVEKAIQDGVDRANAHATSNAQRVQKWLLLPTDFSVPGGELGPMLKLKRHVVLEKNARAVDKMYG